MRFQQSVAIVTGGGSGIGKATAERLAREGASVIIVGRTKEKLDRAAVQIGQEHPEASVYTFSADVTKEEEVRALEDYVRREFGKLHVVINNAGGSADGRILEMKMEDWGRSQDLNLSSVFLVSKILSPLLIE
ncbi:MAG TPA: SDR family NAD(P)-dependent oxidoreductase, partial [Chondromyces sp.]|nr:SDR family NAD(P)-dependent oxidoreductase [Chondromyces sp.]